MTLKLLYTAIVLIVRCFICSKSSWDPKSLKATYEYNGDFELAITAMDSSGKNISKTINWSYYELQ